MSSPPTANAASDVIPGATVQGILLLLVALLIVANKYIIAPHATIHMPAATTSLFFASMAALVGLFLLPGLPLISFAFYPLGVAIAPFVMATRRFYIPGEIMLIAAIPEDFPASSTERLAARRREFEAEGFFSCGLFEMRTCGSSTT